MGKRTVDIEGERASLAARVAELDAEVVAKADWFKTDVITLQQFEAEQVPERRAIQERRHRLNELERCRALREWVKMAGHCGTHSTECWFPQQCNCACEKCKQKEQAYG